MIKPEHSGHIKKPHQRSMLKAFGSVFEAQNKRFLFASVCLHIVVILLLVFSWSSADVVKTVTLPSNLHARVLSLDEVKALKSKKQAEEKKISDQKRKKKQEKRLKQKKQKLKSDKLKKEKAKKKAEAKRKKAAKQKALKIKKQKDKKAQEKKAQEKKKLERTKREELARTKRAEEKERRLESERLEVEKQDKVRHDAEVKSLREKRLLEQMNAFEEMERARQDNLLKQKQVQAAQEYELTEIERFMSLIRAKIWSRWHVPPKSTGLSLLLRIRLLPSRELESVNIIESSGKAAFDRSAINAVRSVRSYPVPDDAGIFDRHFRQFSMRFTPES